MTRPNESALRSLRRQESRRGRQECLRHVHRELLTVPAREHPRESVVYPA